MQWPMLLNWDRFNEERRWSIEPARSPWQIDYDRIIFSSAFRRLQDKTQVFPLSGSDYVRTRLTHTLEVSTVARTLGTRAGEVILGRHGREVVDNRGKSARLKDLVTPAEVGAIVSAAALAHDLGNPPFGHSGEDAVRHWFETSSRLKNARKAMTAAQQEDFRCWEGNAQGFRILTRLQLYKEKGGMRLTNSTLAAFCKYPCRSLDSLEGTEKPPASRKKFGVFKADLGALNSIAEATGLKRSTTKYAWCRHPLAFLMEAADDICYRVVDLEDGFRLQRVTYKTAYELLRGIATEVTDARLAQEPDERAKVAYLRAVAVRTLIEEASSVFADKEADMLTGKFDRELLTLTPSSELLKQIKTQMKKTVYKTQGVLETEAAGFHIIPGLLDLFWSAVSADASERHHRRAHKVLQLIPEDYRGPRGHAADQVYERMLRITDYVSGMTDSFALSLYRKLNGIALPM